MQYFIVTGEVDAIDGGSKWCMPTPSCPGCGRRGGNSGFNYPFVDLEQYSNDLDLESFAVRKRGSVDWAGFRRLQEKLCKLDRRLDPLPPGTGLGPVVGKAFGRWDFGSPNFNILCVREHAYAALRDHGFSGLQAAKTQLTGYKRTDSHFLQLVLPRVGEVSAQCRPESCGVCLRFALEKGEVVVRRDSLPGGTALFRLRAKPKTIIASEEFYTVVQRQRLTGLVFEPVALAES